MSRDRLRPAFGRQPPRFGFPAVPVEGFAAGLLLVEGFTAGLLLVEETPAI
jgi:hypothetical protein